MLLMENKNSSTKSRESKRQSIVLIPVLFSKGDVFVCLQRRDRNIEYRPNCFGFWGGGVKTGEEPEESLKREIKQELDFLPSGYTFLGTYEGIHDFRYIYTLKVNEEFEKEVSILEGQYGKYFTEEEIVKESLLTDEHKTILRDTFEVWKEKYGL